MARMNWKKAAPTSIRNAIELCVKHASARKNMSVERIADHMGLESHWVIYKWMENGRMPSILIRPFESACGCTYVTQWIATSAHKLLTDIPTGHTASNDDLLELSDSFNDALKLLRKFYKGKAQQDETIEALTSILAEIAGHRENVRKAETPELPLFNEGGEL